MVFFGLIDALRNYCNTNNITFLYGNDAYVNAISDGIYTDLILIADFNCNPTFNAGVVVNCKYDGIISLGQKTDDITISNLDETPIQKYDNRLRYLTTALAELIGVVSCENELLINSVNFRFDLNKFDLNADFVAANIILEQ